MAMLVQDWVPWVFTECVGKWSLRDHMKVTPNMCMVKLPV